MTNKLALLSNIFEWVDKRTYFAVILNFRDTVQVLSLYSRTIMIDVNYPKRV